MPTTTIPADVDALLTRRRTAEALTESGFPTSEKTLATKASRGGGPPFQHFGPRVLYRWGHALDWAQSLLSPIYSSTSAADALAKHQVDANETSNSSISNNTSRLSSTADTEGS
jgi:hypothetical protein